MQVGNYLIEKEIGEGGMSNVYLAKHHRLQKNVAIKVLKSEYLKNENIRQRFLSEARNMFGMNHSNIVRVTDLIEEDGLVAFVMEYIEGLSLKEFLEQKKSLQKEKVIELFSQMLDAVGYVHSMGIVHRDLKPSNFIIDSKGKIKLLDFGIAKNTDQNSVDYTLTQTQQSMGTPLYMSPEQIKSSKSVTIHSDIYSLGVVLWQMVMGKKPYATESLSLFDIHSKIVTEKLVDTKTEFDPLINKATEKTFHDRFENCNEFRNALLLLNDTFKNASNERTSVSEDVTEVLIKSPKSENELEKPNESPSALQNNKSVKKAILAGSVILLVFLSLVAFNKVFRSDSGISNNQAESKLKSSGSILKIENATNSSLSVAVAFKNGDYQTKTTGWYSVEPNGITQVKIPNDVSEDDVFWFAKSNNGKEFSGKDVFLCIESGSFTYNNQESIGCSGKKGFKRANHAYALIEE